MMVHGGKSSLVLRGTMLIALMLLISACSGGDNHQVPVGKSGEAELAISGAEDVPGTGWLRASIVPRSRGLGGSSYSTENPRNILIIDAASGASRRLLRTNDRIIYSQKWLPDAPATVSLSDFGEHSGPPIAFYVLSVRQGGESRLIDIHVGSVSEGGAKPVMTGVQELYSATSLGEGRVVLLLAKGGRALHVLVDARTGEILSQTPVTIQ